jgi:hypothetical protein
MRKTCTISGRFSWIVNGDEVATVARAVNKNADVLEKLIARVDDLEKQLKDQKAAAGEV